MDAARHIPWTVWRLGRTASLTPTIAPLALAGAVLTCVPVAVALGSTDAGAGLGTATTA